jgi:hypothetical protein
MNRCRWNGAPSPAFITHIVEDCAMKTLTLSSALLVLVAAHVAAQVREPADPTRDPVEEQRSSSPQPASDPKSNMSSTPAPSTQPSEGTSQQHEAPEAAPPRDSSLSGPDAGGHRESSMDSASTSANAQAPTQTQLAAEPAVQGTQVVTNADQPLGAIVDTVFDAIGQPDFVVISAGDSMTAMPYRAAKAMMSGDKIVIDRSRLAKAPKVLPGEWHNDQAWKELAIRYWEGG